MLLRKLTFLAGGYLQKSMSIINKGDVLIDGINAINTLEFKYRISEAPIPQRNEPSCGNQHTVQELMRGASP